MNEDILINCTPQETRVAVMQAGVPQELHIERAASRGLVGNIYVGRVARVLPGMQSAFIEIGLERAGFLHVADIWEERQVTPEARSKPIEKILSENLENPIAKSTGCRRGKDFEIRAFEDDVNLRKGQRVMRAVGRNLAELV